MFLLVFFTSIIYRVISLKGSNTALLLIILLELVCVGNDLSKKGHVQLNTRYSLKHYTPTLIAEKAAARVRNKELFSSLSDA